MQTLQRGVRIETTPVGRMRRKRREGTVRGRTDVHARVCRYSQTRGTYMLRFCAGGEARERKCSKNHALGSRRSARRIADRARVHDMPIGLDPHIIVALERRIDRSNLKDTQDPLLLRAGVGVAIDRGAALCRKHAPTNFK